MFSTVRSNDSGEARARRTCAARAAASPASGMACRAQVGFLRDVRRLNVAITRAQSKLLLLGSARTLAAGSPVMAQLLEEVRRRGWLLPLPADALGRGGTAHI